MRADKERIQDILNAIERIERFTSEGKNHFFSNEMIQSAVIYQIQIIGEASYKISEDFKLLYKDIPWKNIEGTRHIIVHDYFRVNLNIIWDVIEKNLPELKKKLINLLD